MIGAALRRCESEGRPIKVAVVGAGRFGTSVIAGVSQMPGVVIAEGVWPDEAYDRKVGINLLTGATPVPPAGGAAFHDTAVWLKAEALADAAD